MTCVVKLLLQMGCLKMGVSPSAACVRTVLPIEALIGMFSRSPISDSLLRVTQNRSQYSSINSNEFVWESQGKQRRSFIISEALFKRNFPDHNANDYFLNIESKDLVKCSYYSAKIVELRYDRENKASLERWCCVHAKIDINRRTVCSRENGR